MVRAWIYDRAFLGLTPTWYRRVLERLPESARLLDVGIGTGGALARNADLLVTKRIRVVGLDIDRDYLRRCVKIMRAKGLTEYVTTVQESVLHHRGGPYDAVYFSASFMLLAEPVRALQQVKKLLKPGGRIHFTQTFQEKRAPLLERMKPLLFHFTTIRFGQVTYVEDFVATLALAGLRIVEHEELGGSRAHSYRWVIAEPIAATNGVNGHSKNGH